MVEIASQNHSEAPQFQADTQDALIASLDDSLTRYLHLLDQYQFTRAALHKDLSSVLSGFLSIAQANFKNPNRIHYGQDFYDERMQATVYASVSSEVESRFSTFQRAEAPAKDAARSEKSVESEGPRGNVAEEDEKKSRENEEPTKEVADPLRWFGVLIPQALRQAQQSFRSAVMEDMEKVLNVRLEMAELEQEIRDRRQEIKQRGLPS